MALAIPSLNSLVCFSLPCPQTMKKWVQICLDFWLENFRDNYELHILLNLHELDRPLAKAFFVLQPS